MKSKTITCGTKEELLTMFGNKKLKDMSNPKLTISSQLDEIEKINPPYEVGQGNNLGMVFYVEEVVPKIGEVNEKEISWVMRLTYVHIISENPEYLVPNFDVS